MADYNYKSGEEPFSVRVMNFLMEIWPGIYKTVNSLFFGTIRFVVDTVSGLWRRY